MSFASLALRSVDGVLREELLAYGLLWAWDGVREELG